LKTEEPNDWKDLWDNVIRINELRIRNEIVEPHQMVIRLDDHNLSTRPIIPATPLHKMRRILSPSAMIRNPV
jgi:hypothetical protein